MANASPEEPKWKKFEKIITEIQKQLAPDAKVEHNVRVTGKSGNECQLDVVVSEKIGPYLIMIVVECKDEMDPVDVGEVREFADKLADVEAQLGIMISTSGFTSGAMKRAVQKSLLLHTYREAEETDWNELIGADARIVFMRFRAEKTAQISITNNPELFGEIPLDTKIYMQAATDDAKNTMEITPEIIFWNWWEQTRQKPLRLGTFEIQIEGTETNFFIQNGASISRIHKFIMRGELIAEKYIANLFMGEGRILEDIKTGNPIHGELTSSSIEWDSIFENQVGIKMSQQEYDSLTNEDSRHLNTFIDPRDVCKTLRIGFVLIPRED